MNLVELQKKRMDRAGLTQHQGWHVRSAWAACLKTQPTRTLCCTMR